MALAMACQMAMAGTALVTQVDYQGDDGGAVPTDAQYRNPVLAGFYPDPSAIRVGNDFYLVTSSFGYFPGLRVFKSSDLVHWTQIGNAIDRPGQINYGNDALTRGLFAASISHHDGTDAATVHVDFAVGDGQWQTLLERGDASLLSTETAGGFLGATFGPYAYRP